METRLNRLSIFSQSLDRTAFIAFFLGAVVPLAGLAVAAAHYVVPEIEDDWIGIGVVVALVSVGALSLGSFLALRRSAHLALARSVRDNERLAALLEAAAALVTVEHKNDAAEALASCARNLSDSVAAFVVVPDEKHGEPEVVARDGDDAEKLYRDLRIEPLAKLALDQDEAIVRGAAPGEEEEPPLAILPIGGGRRASGALAVVRSARAQAFEQRALGSLATLASLGSVAIQNADMHETQRNFFTHATDLLVSALERTLDYNEGHARRVAALSNRIGHELGLEDERLQRLYFAALLHDIGMLKISLDQHADMKVIRTHATLGYRMLVSIRVWAEIARFVLYHHEWWNGGGYPEGLSGEDIPLESRIVGLAEAVDSMTSSTSYKEPVSLDEAVRRVRDCSGTQFDPTVANALIALHERDEIPHPDRGV